MRSRQIALKKFTPPEGECLKFSDRKLFLRRGSSVSSAHRINSESDPAPHRLAGLDSRYRGAAYRRRTAQTEARILEFTRRGPRDGSTHWSSYRLAKEFGISQSTVSRVWRQFGFQPHRSRSYMASNDPEFEAKAADIIGLYLKPPLHAAVFSLTRRVLSKLLTVWIRYCPFLLAAPSGMVSSITAMEPFHSTAL
jgi:transposase